LKGKKNLSPKKKGKGKKKNAGWARQNQRVLSIEEGGGKQ